MKLTKGDKRWIAQSTERAFTPKMKMQQLIKELEIKNEKELFEHLNIKEENLLEDIKKDLLETCEINKNINWDDQETAPSEECLLFIDNLNRYIPKYQNPNTEWQEIKKDIVSKLEDFSSSENPNVFFNDLGITIENLFSNKEEK